MNNNKSINLLAIVAFGCIQIHAMNNKPKPPSALNGTEQNIFKNKPNVFKARPGAFEKKPAAQAITDLQLQHQVAHSEIEQFSAAIATNNAQANDIVAAVFVKINSGQNLTAAEMEAVQVQMQAIKLSNQQAFEQAQSAKLLDK